MMVPRTAAVRLAVAYALSGALVAALLVTFAYNTYGPVPGPLGEPYGRTTSADGRWVAQCYYVNEDVPRGRITVEPADGGEVRLIYYGPPANALWRGQDVVITEEESRRQHAISVRQSQNGFEAGKWDSRTGDRLEFWGYLLPVLAVVAGALLLDIRLLRRWTRPLASIPASFPGEWRPDLTGRHQLRYWNGRGWTEHVADAGVTSTDAVEPSDLP